MLADFLYTSRALAKDRVRLERFFQITEGILNTDQKSVDEIVAIEKLDAVKLDEAQK